MTDRDALLAAIRAEPDDDTPRLAFADWLDAIGRKGVAALAAGPLGPQLRYLNLLSNDGLHPDEAEIRKMFPNAHVRVQFDFL